MLSEGFYFIKDEYFIDFPDDKLMKNREVINRIQHDRPCFYAFKDNQYDIYWMIPISSRVDKFLRIYNDKVNRYGYCDTIVFGTVLGHNKAFLIQNMCPVTKKYIEGQYFDYRGVPVNLPMPLKQNIIKKAKNVLTKQRRGINLIFPDVIKIEQKLKEDIK